MKIDVDPLPLRAMRAVVEECKVRMVDDYTRKVHYECNFCKKKAEYWGQMQHENDCIVLECQEFLNL